MSKYHSEAVRLLTLILGGGRCLCGRPEGQWVPRDPNSKYESRGRQIPNTPRPKLAKLTLTVSAKFWAHLKSRCKLSFKFHFLDISDPGIGRGIHLCFDWVGCIAMHWTWSWWSWQWQRWLHFGGRTAWPWPKRLSIIGPRCIHCIQPPWSSRWSFICKFGQNYTVHQILG